MKGELEELGEETDDNVENLSKMQGQILNLTHGKVNIFDDSGEFKSTYEILQGIASVWEDLSSTDQATLLETVAGKHRANDVAAIFQNWKNVEAATESATEATGSAMAEQQKYADSLQGRLNSLTASFQEFSNTAVNSDFLKNTVSAATGLLDIIDDVVDKFGLLPTIATASAAGMSLAGKGFFKVIEDETKKFGYRTNILEIFDSIKDKFAGVKEITKNIFGNIDNKSSSLFTSLDTSFINNLDTDIAKLKEFREIMQNSDGASISESIANTMNGASDAAKNFAKTWDMSEESLNNFSTAQLRNQGVIKNTGKSLGDCGRMISAYNNAAESGKFAQDKLTSSFAKVNPAMGKFLTNANGAKVSLGGYIGSLISAKVATFALQAATLALNVALTAGISVLVSAGISALMSWINRADELAEKVNDVTTKYNQQKETLNENKKSIDEISESYERLSKGVNTVNNDNMTLSTDEYKEYCDIVNQIADMFPELVSGYDAQGNAVLTCAGNVEKLNEAYREAAESNYNDVLKDAGDIFDDFKNKSKDIEGGNLWGDSFLYDKGEMNKNSYEALKKVLEENDGSDLGEKITKYITSNSDIRDEISNALENAGLEYDFGETQIQFINRAIKENPKIAKQIVSDFEGQMSEAVKGMQTAAESYIGKAFLDGDYSQISDNMQEVMTNIIPNLGYDYFSQFDEVDELYKSLDDMLGSINSLDDGGKKTFETYFDLQAKVNNGECTVGEYVSNLDEVSSVIDSLDIDDESKKALKLSFQLEENDIKDQYDSFVNKLVDAGKGKDAAKKLVDGLTATELKAAVKLEAEGKVDLKNIDMGDLKKQIQKEAKYLEAMNFTIDIEGETDSLEKFNSALAETRSGAGLTLESMQALESRYSGLENYDAARLFEETANGLSLNATAVNEYEKALAETNLDETNENIGALKDKYDELTGQIQNCSDATQKANLINEQENIRQKISELAELATMYEGLTSSYNEWQNAENAGNNRDMYQNVYSAQENIKKELDNGWIDDGTKEYFQLIWGEDKWDGAGKSVQDYRDKWATLGKTIKGTSYSINDFFKTNEDGELTSEGIFNFFDAVKQKQKELGKDWVKTDKDGNVKSFNFGVDGDKAVADALGIGEELVQIFERAAQDCGFVVNFEGTYTQLADMQNEAQAAANKLNELDKTKFKFDFNTKDVDNLNKQLDVAKKVLDGFKDKDGKVNFKAEGAKEAMQVASTLQATTDNLDNHYIGLTVEDDSFEEPLEKLQDYETKTAEINQLKLDPKVNAKEIEKLEGDLDNTVNYFDNLDDDQKKKIGIDVDDSPEKIKEKIESGKIEIPTSLDIQTNMSETLDDLKDLALLSSGYLTEDQEIEIKAKLGITTDEEEIKNEANKAAKTAEEIIKNVEPDINFSDSGKERATKFLSDTESSYVKDYDKDEQINVVKFVADWSDIDNYKPEEKKAVVEFVKDIDDIESYRPEQRQAIVNFVKDVDDINSYKPEEKEAIAKFVANTDGVDSYEPEQKTAVAQFVKDSIDVDSYEPEDRKAIAEFVKDSKDVDSYTPDEKRAIAKYAVESGDVDNYSPEERSAIVNFLTNSADPDSYTPEQKTAIAKFLKESGEVDGYQPNQKQAIARFLKDSSEPDSYQPDPKTQNVTSKLNSSEVDNYNPPEKQMTIWATIKKKASDLWNKLTGGGDVDGTAHVQGTAYTNGSTGKAFAKGNWGTKENGVALGGELGTELLVRKGRWYTIGDNGAEFFGYKRGDIIFNADQTRELFEKGKITHGSGRGKALASGTAFTYGTGSSKPTYASSSSSKKSTSKTSKNKSSSSSSSSSDKETKEEFDWIEVKIDRIEREISRLDKTANNTFISWKSVTSALNKELSKTKDEIDIQNQAYKRYMKEANKYGKGLSKTWKNRVKNGTINISTIKNEKFAEKIKNYQTWYLIMPTCLVIDM